MTADLVALVAERRPDVVAFATALSLAVRIDRALARAIRARLAPSADASLETDLWSSPLVQVRGDGECTLRASVAAALWQQLPADPFELATLWSLYEARHASLSPLVRLEERLAYLAHLSSYDLPEAGEPADAVIDRELRAVVAAMDADPTRRRDLAAWSARALARLPQAVRDSEGARILGAATAGWVAAPVEVAALTPSLEGAAVVRRLAPPSARPQRTIAIRRARNRIDVSPSPSTDGAWASLEIAASPFALYLDDDHEIALDRHAITAIDVSDSDVVIGDADGKRWLVPAPRSVPELSAIAALTGPHGSGYAYLVAPAIAATCAHLLGDPTWHATLRFDRASYEGYVLAFDHELDLALIELSGMPTSRPLSLATTAHVNDAWRAYGSAFPLPAFALREAPVSTGRVVAAGPAPRIAVTRDHAIVPGTPIFVGDRVIGHARRLTVAAPIGDIQELELCGASTVEAMLARLATRTAVTDPEAPLRHAELVTRHPLDLDGLVITRDVNGAIAHRTPGRRPWSVAIASRPLETSAARILAILEPIGSGEPIMIADGAGDQRRLRAAVERAASMLRETVEIQPGETTLRVALPALAVPPPYALRRAARLVLETLFWLTELDQAAPHDEYLSSEDPRLVSRLTIHGRAPLDLGELQAWLAEHVRGQPRVIEIDPETQLVTISSADPDDLLDALRALWDHGTVEVHEDTPMSDQLRGQLGVSARRRGFELAVTTGDDGARLRVKGAPDRPLRGYVSFHVPAEISNRPIRIRASAGHAECRIDRVHDDRFTVGAVVEEDGVPLEAVVPARLEASLVHVGVVTRLHTQVWDCASTDPNTLAIAAEDHALWLVRASDGRRDNLRGHTARVFGCASVDGVHLVSASADHTVRVWDLASRNVVRVYEDHTDEVCACAITPDGERVVSVGADLVVRVWELATGRTLFRLDGHASRIYDCAIAPDGRHAVTAAADETLRIWDLETGEARAVLVGHRGRVNCCRISPDGRFVLSASHDTTLKLWELGTGQLVRTFEGHTTPVETCAFSPDGKWIASASTGGTLRLWDVRRGTCTINQARDGAAQTCAWLPGSKRLVTVAYHGEVRVWDLDDGTPTSVPE